MLIGGKHVGTIRKVYKIEGTKIFFTAEGEIFETLKKYVSVLGQSKPEIKARS